MKIVYDPEVDALHIWFQETTVTTKELTEGVSADYDRNGQLAGIEVLGSGTVPTVVVFPILEQWTGGKQNTLF